MRLSNPVNEVGLEPTSPVRVLFASYSVRSFTNSDIRSSLSLIFSIRHKIIKGYP